MKKLLSFHAVNSLSHCLESQQQSVLSLPAVSYLSSQSKVSSDRHQSLPGVSSLFPLSIKNGRWWRKPRGQKQSPRKTKHW